MRKMRSVSSVPLLSIHTFFSIQWLCLRTAIAPISFCCSHVLEDTFLHGEAHIIFQNLACQKRSISVIMRNLFYRLFGLLPLQEPPSLHFCIILQWKNMLKTWHDQHVEEAIGNLQYKRLSIYVHWVSQVIFVRRPLCDIKGEKVHFFDQVPLSSFRFYWAVAAAYNIKKSHASRKHAYIILTPLNPTFI